MRNTISYEAGNKGIRNFFFFFHLRNFMTPTFGKDITVLLPLFKDYFFELV